MTLRRDVTDDTTGRAGVRLDRWLWAARFFKTRSLAADAVDAGRVDVNGDRARRSRLLTVGDVVSIRRPPFEQTVKVLALSDARGPASVAAGLYEESAESRSKREQVAAQLRAGGPVLAGRPGKRDRRLMDRLRGRRR
ncbi:MAG: RNA-binding S4 domain-containing protein [Gemmatimonadota bacterium]